MASGAYPAVVAPFSSTDLPTSTLAVGFDLDMTLVDSRVGIVATIRAVLGELGVRITDDEVWRGIGTPLQQMFGPYVAADQVPGAVRRYRELYPTTGVPGITLLRGADVAFAAVRAMHVQVVVVIY
jgi:phosphoglycolate phosphatase-like HAD superfamily hydrolase